MFSFAAQIAITMAALQVNETCAEDTMPAMATFSCTCSYIIMYRAINSLQLRRIFSSDLHKSILSTRFALVSEMKY